MNYHQFFMESVPAMLSNLKADAAPLWGQMSAPEMIAHLQTGIKMSLENVGDEITTPEEKLAGYKKFLMSDRPFVQGLQEPPFYVMNKKEASGDIEDLKLDLMKALVEMQTYFLKNPDHTAIHPNFGTLNGEEWMHLHKKHILHHFTQFGIA